MLSVIKKTIRGEIHDDGFWDFNEEDIVYKIAEAPKLPSEAAAKQKLKDIKSNMILDKGIKLFIQSVADAERQKANQDKMWDLVHGKKK